MKRGISPERDSAAEGNPQKKARHSREAVVALLNNLENEAYGVKNNDLIRNDLLKLFEFIEFEDLDIRCGDGLYVIDHLIEIDYPTDDLMRILHRFKDRFTKEYFLNRKTIWGDKYGGEYAANLFDKFLDLAENDNYDALDFVLKHFLFKFSDFSYAAKVTINQNLNKQKFRQLLTTATLEDFLLLFSTTYNNRDFDQVWVVLFNKFKDQLKIEHFFASEKGKAYLKSEDTFPTVKVIVEDEYEDEDEDEDFVLENNKIRMKNRFRELFNLTVDRATLEDFISLINREFECPLLSLLMDRFKDEIKLEHLLKINDSNGQFPLFILAKQKKFKEIKYFLENLPGVIPPSLLSLPLYGSYISLSDCQAELSKLNLEQELGILLQGEVEPFLYKLVSLKTGEPFHATLTTTPIDYFELFKKIVLSVGKHLISLNEHGKAANIFSLFESRSLPGPPQAMSILSDRKKIALDSLSNFLTVLYPRFNEMLIDRNEFYHRFDKVKAQNEVAEGEFSGLLHIAEGLQKIGYKNPSYEVAVYFRDCNNQNYATRAFLQVPNDHKEYQAICLERFEVELALAQGIYQRRKTNHLENALKFSFGIQDECTRQNLIQRIAGCYIFGDKQMSQPKMKDHAYIPADWVEVIFQIHNPVWTLDRFDEIKQSLKLEKKRQKLNLSPKLEIEEDTTPWLAKLEEALKQEEDSDRFDQVQSIASTYVGMDRSDLVPRPWFSFINHDTDTAWFFRRLQDIKRDEEIKVEIETGVDPHYTQKVELKQ